MVSEFCLLPIHHWRPRRLSPFSPIPHSSFLIPHWRLRRLLPSVSLVFSDQWLVVRKISSFFLFSLSPFLIPHSSFLIGAIGAFSPLPLCGLCALCEIPLSSPFLSITITTILPSSFSLIPHWRAPARLQRAFSLGFRIRPSPNPSSHPCSSQSDRPPIHDGAEY